MPISVLFADDPEGLEHSVPQVAVRVHGMRSSLLGYMFYLGRFLQLSVRGCQRAHPLL